MNENSDDNDKRRNRLNSTPDITAVLSRSLNAITMECYSTLFQLSFLETIPSGKELSMMESGLASPRNVISSKIWQLCSSPLASAIESLWDAANVTTADVISEMRNAGLPTDWPVTQTRNKDRYDPFDSVDSSGPVNEDYSSSPKMNTNTITNTDSALNSPISPDAGAPYVDVDTEQESLLYDIVGLRSELAVWASSVASAFVCFSKSISRLILLLVGPVFVLVLSSISFSFVVLSFLYFCN